MRISLGREGQKRFRLRDAAERNPWNFFFFSFLFLPTSLAPGEPGTVIRGLPAPAQRSTDRERAPFERETTTPKSRQTWVALAICVGSDLKKPLFQQNLAILILRHPIHVLWSPSSRPPFLSGCLSFARKKSTTTDKQSHPLDTDALDFSFLREVVRSFTLTPVRQLLGSTCQLPKSSFTLAMDSSDESDHAPVAGVAFPAGNDDFRAARNRCAQACRRFNETPEDSPPELRSSLFLE